MRANGLKIPNQRPKAKILAELAIWVGRSRSRCWSYWSKPRFPIRC